MSLAAFGRMVDVEKAAVWKWENGGDPAPTQCIKIEEKTNGEIPRWMLRSDLWPAPNLEAAQ